MKAVAIRIALVILVTGCASPPPLFPDDPDPDAIQLFVLGTVQDGGLPHLGCEKPCCTEARRLGQRRYQASLGIHHPRDGRLVLLEATPSVEHQIALLHDLAGVGHRDRKPVDAVLLTHAHIGHYLGLAHFGKEVASTQGLPVHVSPRFAEFLRGHGPWKQLVALEQIVLEVFEPRGEFQLLDGVWVTPIPVPHRDEFSDTMAFKLRGPNRTVLFVPDVDKWDVEPDLLDRLFDGVDVAYVDGTFYDGRELPDRDMSLIPHPPIVDTMARLAGRAQARPGSVRFIHLNHTNPALRDKAIRADIEARGFRIAERGERLTL